ncbi:MAG: 3-isopropylmalate dehydrogenase, partial [Armatimonadetes bacterium]|nr:3-isopropylmalate dehydrogenase [Armatimonadota bacterium]
MPKIAVLAGDGIGPEIIEQGKRALVAVAETFALDVTLTDALVGGAAYDATGHPLPPETLQLCRESDAILLGAVGAPKYDLIEPADLRPERGALLPLRKHLELFANLRPAILSPALAASSPLRADIVAGGLDVLVVRELTGGLYFGQPKSNDGERAVDTCVYTKPEIARIAQVAFAAAQKRGKKLCSVDKANVLETSRLWRTVVHEVAAQ